MRMECPVSDEKANSAKVVPIAAGKSQRSQVSLVRLPAPVHRVREKGIHLFQEALKNLFDGADDALFALADRAESNLEQNIYFEAMREVRLKRRSMEKSFFTELDRGFAALLRASAALEDEFDADVSVDELSIVENEQLEYQVALESMTAKALKSVAEPSQHLAMRIDSLVPAKVYQRNNPLGPERLCEAFWRVVEPLDLNTKAKLIVLKLFEKAVISQLDKVYTVLNNSLIQQNILPSLATRQTAKSAAQKRRSTDSATTPVEGAGATQGLPAGSVAADAQSDPQLWEKLRTLLSGQVSGGGQGGAAQAASTLPVMTPNALLDALSSIQNFLRSRNVDTSGTILTTPQLLKLVQQQGHQQARFSEPDQDVIHLINMMFEFILDDRNLAAPMKALLARLQIPLLKVALEDKQFFNVAGHPARRLLNELATAALGWQPMQDDPAKDPLYKKIDTTVSQVLSEFETDVGVFEVLLTEFITFVEKEQRRAVVLERRIVDAEDGKAKAEQAKAHVAEQISMATEGKSLPECVSQILLGPWQNVLLLTLLKHGDDSDQWQSGCKTVKDLVWSVTAAMDDGARLRLMSLLPDLLSRIKGGFELIAFNSFEMNDLLRQLESVHLQRLRQPDEPQVVEEEQVGEEITTADLADELSDDLTEDMANELASEVDEAMGVLDHADEPESMVTSLWLDKVDQLKQGTWFEVAEEGKPPYRCRLAALLKSVNRYIFVNRNGMKVADKSRVELASALENGEFQVLDDGMLFDRALESVIGNLRAARQQR